MLPAAQSACRADELLAAADRDLTLAGLAVRPADRYAASHLAALRIAAAVLAARPAAPAAPPVRQRGVRRRRPSNAWSELAVAAPELAAWADHFAAGAGKRAAAVAGFSGAVSAGEADGLMRDSGTFLGVVRALLAA